MLLQGRDHFMVNTFFLINEQLLNELKRRKSFYNAVTANFEFLCKLDKISEVEIKVNAIKFQNSYPIDLADDLQKECIILKHFLTSKENKMSKNINMING